MPSTRNIAEILGVTGVIGSLIFVGLELDQNSAIARTSAYHQYVQGWTEYNLAMATDDQLNSLYVRVREGQISKDFTPEENSKLVFSYIALVRQWEGVYRSVQEGILPPELLYTFSSARGLKRPAFAEKWTGMRFMFTQDSVDFMENEVLNNEQ